jgi:hypothetical protein
MRQWHIRVTPAHPQRLASAINIRNDMPNYPARKSSEVQRVAFTSVLMASQFARLSAFEPVSVCGTSLVRFHSPEALLGPASFERWLGLLLLLSRLSGIVLLGE